MPATAPGSQVSLPRPAGAAKAGRTGRDPNPHFPAPASKYASAVRTDEAVAEGIPSPRDMSPNCKRSGSRVDSERTVSRTAATGESSSVRDPLSSHDIKPNSRLAALAAEPERERPPALLAGTCGRATGALRGYRACARREVLVPWVAGTDAATVSDQASGESCTAWLCDRGRRQRLDGAAWGARPAGRQQVRPVDGAGHTGSPSHSPAK